VRSRIDGERSRFPQKSVWQSVLVSMFLHGSLLHLGGNLLFLWILGNNIEDHLGPIRYTLFYVLGGIVATLAHVVLNLDSTIPMIGASGAIAAVMGAYLVWFPDAPVRTLLTFFFILVVRIRAKWLLGFWFALQFLTSPNSGVAWAAHAGGFVAGVLVGLGVRASPGLRRLLWRRSARTALGARWDPTGGAGYAFFTR
jgi:membrane associated rhomboid family serine protease